MTSVRPWEILTMLSGFLDNQTAEEDRNRCGQTDRQEENPQRFQMIGTPVLTKLGCWTEREKECDEWDKVEERGTV